MNHRRIQRLLFRMALDPDYCRQIYAGDREAIESSECGAAEIQSVLAVDPRDPRADFENRRRLQVLGNLVLEYPLCWRAAPSGWMESFFGSKHFHDTIRHDGHLAPAFGAWIKTHAESAAQWTLMHLATAELALAKARRAPDDPASPSRGTWSLSPRVQVIDLPAGAGTLLPGLWQQCAEGREVTMCSFQRETSESALVLGAPRSHSHGHRAVSLEELKPEVAALIQELKGGLTDHHVSGVAQSFGAPTQDLYAFLKSLQRDGIVIYGGSE